jgi:hypothetical protein
MEGTDSVGRRADDEASPAEGDLARREAFVERASNLVDGGKVRHVEWLP